MKWLILRCYPLFVIYISDVHTHLHTRTSTGACRAWVTLAQGRHRKRCRVRENKRRFVLTSILLIVSWRMHHQLLDTSTLSLFIAHVQRDDDDDDDDDDDPYDISVDLFQLLLLLTLWGLSHFQLFILISVFACRRINECDLKKNNRTL